MIAAVIALCGLALMLAASRCGTAAIVLVVVAVALLGIKASVLYVFLPAAAAFVAWIVWLYLREGRKVREETAIGQAVLAAAIENAAGGQSRNHAGGAPTPEDETGKDG